MNKIKRFEVRLSEEERKILEQIKSSTGKNISDVFREFLYSYDLDNSKKNLEKEINELELERDITIHNLYSVYSKIRKTYLPYKLVFDLLEANENYYKRYGETSKEFKEYPDFKKITDGEERLKQLDNLRTERDSFKSKLKAIENKIYKLKLNQRRV